MTSFLDPFLLALLVATPLVGALFVWVTPSTDRLTLRHMGVMSTLFTLVLVLRAGQLLYSNSAPSFLATTHVTLFEWPLLLEVKTLPWLLSSSMVFGFILRAGAARITHRTKSYVALMLLTQASVNGALLAKSPIGAWALMALSCYPITYILGVFGGSRRGESALSFVVAHGSFDGISLLALSWLLASQKEGQDLFEVALGLEGTTSIWVFIGLSMCVACRMLMVPFSSWSRALTDNAPVSVAALVLCVTPMLGASFFLRYSVYLPQAILRLFPILAGLVLVGCVLGAANAMFEKQMRLFSLGAARMFSGIALLAFLSVEAEAIWFGQAVLATSSVAICALLIVLESVERRYVTLDSVELVGMRTQLPSLWKALFAAFMVTLSLPFAGAGLFLFRLIPMLGMNSGAASAGLPPNAGWVLTPLVLFLWCTLAIAASRHIRRTGSFPLGQLSAVPSPLLRGQALRLWTAILGGVLLGFFLLQGESRMLLRWNAQLSMLKAGVIQTPATNLWRGPTEPTTPQIPRAPEPTTTHSTEPVIEATEPDDADPGDLTDEGTEDAAPVDEAAALTTRAAPEEVDADRIEVADDETSGEDAP